MSATVGVGIIGLSANGGWAANAHLPALRALGSRYEVRGLCGSSPEAARAAGEKHNVAFHTDDPHVLANRPDIDLIVIAVKVPEHKSLTEAAISAGKAVYCEWPLGNGLDEAIYLERLAADRGVANFVGLQARSAPVLRQVRDLIASGYVGRVLSTTIVADGGRPWGGVTYPSGVYLNDVSTGATMLTIPFGHTVDLVQWALTPFQNVSATLAVRRPLVEVIPGGDRIKATAPDQVAVHGELQDGVVAAFHFRGGASRGPNFNWQILGDEGELWISGGNGHLQYGQVTLSGARDAAKGLAPMPEPDFMQDFDVPPSSHAFTVANAYAALHSQLTRHIGDVPTFADAVKTHQLIQAIQTSATEGRRMAVEDVRLNIP